MTKETKDELIPGMFGIAGSLMLVVSAELHQYRWLAILWGLALLVFGAYSSLKSTR